MIVSGKIKGMLLQEDYIKKYEDNLRGVVGALERDYNKWKLKEIVSIYEDWNMGLDRPLVRTYKRFFEKFYEKSGEDLFMSFWKEKNSSSVYYDSEVYQLVGADTLYNRFGKSFGDYYLLGKYRISVRKYLVDEDTDKLHWQFIKLYKYLTLEEIKSKFDLVDIDKIVNEKFKTVESQNIDIEAGRIAL